VPVTISGSWRIIGRKEWRLKSGEVEVFVHEPMEVARGGKDSEELTERVRDMIQSRCRVPGDTEEQLREARAAALNVA